MGSIDYINLVLLVGAALVLAGILSSLIARRFGTPLLLVFLLIGMAVGQDGPGGLRFDDYRLTYLVGSLALAIILFDGGLRAQPASFRGVLGPAAVLSTLGVVVTAGLTGLFAAAVLHLGVVEGLLVGATVASTDAAAVFFLLGSRGLQIRGRINSLLEIESSTNDPVAVVLTLLLVSIVEAGARTGGAGDIVIFLAEQALIGGVVGALGGFILASAVNRIGMPAGLHPLLILAGAVAVFGLTARLDGSGFLAVYIAGVVVARRAIRAVASIIAFHDAATWLAQIVMFIMLGLLVTPSDLLGTLPAAVAIAVFLMVIGRPVAVVLCLLPFGFERRELGYVSWVGLRGAVSIFLAAIPTLVGVPHSQVYFHIAFVVVLISLLLQGWSLSPLASWLGLALPRRRPRVHRVDIDLPGQMELDMVGYRIEEGSAILATGTIPAWVRPAFVVREDTIVPPETAGALRQGDYGYFLVPPRRVGDLDRLFAPREDGIRPSLTGFPIHGRALLGMLDSYYNLGLAPELRDRTVAQHFEIELEGEPTPGDAVPIGRAILVAREVKDGRVLESTFEFELPDRAGRLAKLWRWLRAQFGGGDDKALSVPSAGGGSG